MAVQGEKGQFPRCDAGRTAVALHTESHEADDQHGVSPAHVRAARATGSRSGVAGRVRGVAGVFRDSSPGDEGGGDDTERLEGREGAEEEPATGRKELQADSRIDRDVAAHSKPNHCSEEAKCSIVARRREKQPKDGCNEAGEVERPAKMREGGKEENDNQRLYVSPDTPDASPSTPVPSTVCR
jgi:hypothetical protein